MKQKLIFMNSGSKRGDKILMCTDGLSNMVEDEDMFGLVKGSRDVVEAVQMLIDRANSNGGRDNIGSGTCRTDCK